jgi:hypothetical protein
MTNPVYSLIDAATNGWINIKRNFTPTTTGTYYLGFHAFTPNYAGDYIDIDDVSVKEAADCSTVNAFPWIENFSSGLPECWQVLGGDEYGNSWIFGTLSGNVIAASFSYLTDGETYGVAVTPDNWLITRQLALGSGSYELSFQVGALSNNDYNENYSVLVSTTGTNTSDFTAIHTETLTNANFKTVTLPLSSYAGQNIYIAFRHWGCTDKYALLLDDVEVSGVSSVPTVNNNKINITQNNGEAFVTVSENSTVRVLDVSGRVFGVYNAEANSTLNIYQPAGLYLFEVRSNSGISTHKLIIK